MQVKIIATRDCNHRPNLERELNALDIPYQLVFAEDQPDEAQRLGIRHSPNLVVDGEVVFRRLPSEAELQAYFARRK
ncbi:MAG: thioredoxin family protein [Gammaproteobacteria bacterium]|nr:thioredoxin family protein [Gammaproteobacteria bacterium]